MATRTLEPEQWEAYMASLTARCGHRPVTLRLQSDEWGDQVLAEHVPFLGMAPERKGSEACGVDIEVGEPGSTATMRHEIACAEIVRVREDEAGTPMAIDIESTDPTRHARITTLLLWD